MAEIPAGKLYFNKSQAAKHLGMSVSEVDVLIDTGQLETSTMGKLRLIPSSAMKAFMNKQDSSSLTNVDLGLVQGQGKTLTSEKFFSIEEAARELGRSVHEVWLKVYLRKIPLKKMDDKKFISETSLMHLRKELGSITKTSQSVSSDSDISAESVYALYFTKEQVIKKLGISEQDLSHAIAQVHLTEKTVNGEVMFSKESVQALSSYLTSSEQTAKVPVSSNSETVMKSSADDADKTPTIQEKFYLGSCYSVAQAKSILGEELYEAEQFRIPSLKFRGVLWLDKDTIDDISKEHENESTTLQPHDYQSVERFSDTVATFSSGSVEDKGRVDIRCLTEAAQRLGKSINQIKDMLEEEKLVVDPGSGKLQPRQSAESRIKPALPNGKNFRVSGKAQAKSTPSKSAPDKNSVDKIRELEEWIQDLQRDVHAAAGANSILAEEKNSIQETLLFERSEYHRLSKNLERERELHIQELKTARSILDQLEAEIENYKRDRKLDPSIENIRKEQAARIEADQRAKELYEELAAERAARLRAENDLLHLKDSQEQLLASKEKIANLEQDSALLSHIKSLLGSSSTNNGIEEPERSEDSTQQPTGVLVIATQYGVWNFRPPFELKDDEVKLLRLVAGEDEIGAEQIKSRTGRKRAVDDLDELLDKLLEGHNLEPIKSENGRYWFERAFLENE